MGRKRGKSYRSFSNPPTAGVWFVMFVFFFLINLFILKGSILAQELPEDPFERGLALYLQGKYAEARDCFSQVLESEPENIEANYRRGFCHLKLNEIDLAGDDFNRIIEIKPDSGLGLTGLALLFIQEKKIMRKP